MSRYIVTLHQQENDMTTNRKNWKKRWQETFNVNGHKITVVIKRRSQVGNFAGYAADITDNKGNEMNIPSIHKLLPEEAQEYAYVKFVQEHC